MAGAKAIYTLVSPIAAIIALGMRISRPALSLLVRLWRLARLRSLAQGRIPATTQFDGPVHACGRSRITLGEYCRLGRDVFFETAGAGRIELGEHVTVNRGCVLVSYAGISIGNDTLIGEYVSIRDANHGVSTHELMRLQPHMSAPITIGSSAYCSCGVGYGGVAKPTYWPQGPAGGGVCRQLLLTPFATSQWRQYLSHTTCGGQNHDLGMRHEA